MGERFQTWISYGTNGQNIFGMHLQWCWGHFSVIRAHQLIRYLDGARQNAFNPFGLGEYGRLGGSSFDGRREDLYLLRALTEINTVSASLVPGHDLIAEENEHQQWQFEEGKLKTFPSTIKIDPLTYDNNHGFLVIKATEHEVKYAFCKSADELKPISAAQYLNSYRSEIKKLDEPHKKALNAIKEDLKEYSVLSKEELTQIFDREYDKKLNIENYQVPERKLSRQESLSDVLKEAASRIEQAQQAPPDERIQDKTTKNREGRSR